MLMLMCRGMQIWGLVLLVVCGAMGCAKQRSEGPLAESSRLDVRLPAVQLLSPLTAEEISALVHIAEQLPGADLPPFATVPASHSLYCALPEFVEAERERLAASLDPRWQATQWGQDPELSRKLDELGVDPVNLATSMLRVSSAWTAMLLESSGTHEGQEATRLSRVRYLELCLGRQLELAQVLFERPLTQWQREQQLEAISETLACLQLARMCAAVPEANLGVIVQHRDLLQPLLPAASALSGFEQRTESKATILQISGEQNAYAPFK